MSIFVYPTATISTTGLATEVKQDAILAELVDVNTELDAVNADKSTAAKQDTGNASLASVDGKVSTAANQSTQITEVQSTNTKLDTGNSSLSSIDTKVATETTLAATAADIAALNAKGASALVPEAHDYIGITYVGATTAISTATYKTGGSGGTTVATITLGYDGSDRLTSVTRS